MATACRVCTGTGHEAIKTPSAGYVCPLQIVVDPYAYIARPCELKSSLNGGWLMCTIHRVCWPITERAECPRRRS